ncbi:hypothetical protein PM033_10595 [Halorubrum ezzemoulense]|nr:hypothetical protein [Halorubrum ezzemoulense]MDB2252223.1 hypothetical protein [Halorubrum ezzemoulense]
MPVQDERILYDCVPITYAHQREQNGLAHALLSVEEYIDDDPVPYKLSRARLKSDVTDVKLAVIENLSQECNERG